ncbi:protein polybromo-1-like isoform X4 [Babylonia areolata]|uniref:protein polybromo-1-like isoform X4 n=1 Tax=Babylonia areolata TaxID=304850 RepID=UPI003FD53EF1
MPSKRKRAGDGKDDREESPGPSHSQPARKKKKIMQYDPQEICQELYDTIRNAKSDGGHLLCEAFIRVPKRRTAADYYDVVTTPIDLLKIQQKLKTEEYDDIDLLTADVLLMINNAKAYYKEDSQEYQDACELWEIYEEVKAELLEETFGELSDHYVEPSVPTSSLHKAQDASESDVTDVEEGVGEEEGGGDKSKAQSTQVGTWDQPLLPPQSGSSNGGVPLGLREPQVTDRSAGPDGAAKGKETKDEEGMELEEGDKSDSATPDSKSESRHDESEELEQLFAAVMTARDGDRNISEVFQLLPSKVKYPEYYETIQEPIDLKTIAMKIQQGKYQNLDELEKDLMLMLRNAQHFNEAKSVIYKDAGMLRRIVQAKKQELDYKRTGVTKTSERLRQRLLNRSRERTTVQRLSAVCAALKYQSEDDDTASSQMEYEGDSDLEDEDSPFWVLYRTVKDYKTPEGDDLSQPFCKLPSKKFYPDYYHEIKKPMSLYNVRKKIKSNQYQTLRECACDINLIFENARKYNQDESKIYKDACTLQKVLIDKKREMDKEGGLDEAPLIVSPFRDSKDGREDEDIVPSVIPKSKGRKSDPDLKKKTPKKGPDDGGLKKRLQILYKTAYDYTDANGRLLRTIFMGLPSRKDYPDYYQVIMEPIDMTMIEAKIKADKYPSEQALLCDFELMFNNARHYNEEGSVVYQDADTLDRILKTKWRSMSQSRATTSKRSKSKTSSPMSQKLQDLFESVRDYQDKAGRALSTPFIKLPLKSVRKRSVRQDYPDYYEVIKKPMDMQRIQQKLLTGQYDNLEDMVADFVQMFDNACKYNEPESVIYKDALTLQRVVFEKKMELMEGTNDVPDVKASVQELIRNLFISTYNSQDDEGRCYSDSFGELPDLMERAKTEDEEQSAERMLTFDQIKRNIDRGRYRRMDRFQEDIFRVFENARKVSRTDSQLYEDAVEMQMLFIKIRDELCKNGELLLTPALSYTERHLQVDLEEEKKEKLPGEQKEEEEKKKSGGEADDKGEDWKPSQDEPSENEIVYKDQTYMVGDFVYIEPRELNLDPHIMMIEKFNTDESGARMIKGCYFYRPNETYHLATRKFLEKEVFKTEQSHEISMSQIMGRCYVMFVKDYFKLKPEGIPDKDVYVCESRYSIRNRCFKKIKIWQSSRTDSVNIVMREVPLVPVRVESVFASREANETKDHDDGDVSVLDKARMNVLSEGPPDDGNTYYDQYLHSSGCLKLGDCVYVRSDRDYPLIARIDKLWTNPEGDAYFHGSWFVRPSEIEHPPTRLFYKREVFLSSIEDTNPLGSVINKCCVLHIKDYCSSRPTEIPEFDIYICESKYHELERSIKKLLGKGLKKHTLSPKVTDDEVYFFRKPIALQKVGNAQRLTLHPAAKLEPSPLLMKVCEDQSSYMETDSVKDTEGDAASEVLGASVEENTPVPEKPTKRKSASNRRQPSGYIVFAGEIRKQIQNENPESSFGDISRIVGMKWRALTKEEKEVFEERARKIADEMAAKQQEADKALNDSLQQSPWSEAGGQPSPGATPTHRPSTPGFASPFPAGYPPTPGGPYPSQYPCPTPPLPPPPPPSSSAQAGAHPYVVPPQPGMFPTHLHPGSPPAGHAMGPPLPPTQGQASPLPPGMHPYPNLPPVSHSLGVAGASPQGAGVLTGQSMAPPAPHRPPSPMFVTVPPRTQRLLHSEAYIKYIEGLNVETRTISNFPKLLAATPDNTPVPNEARLPTQWLAQGAGYHGSVTNALWALRDLMLKDTLTIARTVPFEEL